MSCVNGLLSSPQIAVSDTKRAVRIILRFPVTTELDMRHLHDLLQHFSVLFEQFWKSYRDFESAIVRDLSFEISHRSAFV